MKTAIISSTVGISNSVETDSYEAGKIIAQEAYDQVEPSENMAALVFASIHYDTPKLIEGIQSVFGKKVQLFGCSTVGVMTRNHLAYQGHQVAIALLSDPASSFRLFLVPDVDKDEFKCGAKLADQVMAGSFTTDPSLLIIYDSWKKKAAHESPELNLATPILEGFKSVYGRWPPLAGLGAWGDLVMLKPNHLIINNAVVEQSIIAMAISGNIKIDTMILHGTRPAGGYHTITKAERNVIFEIDGQPALDVLGKLMGDKIPWEQFPLFITLGINRGEKFGEFHEEDYANRLCLAIDKENKALVMFETDLRAGDEFQLMRRTIDKEYIGIAIEEKLATLDVDRLLFAFYIDCMGRRCDLSSMPFEEGKEVQKAIGDIPFLGMYSGVEIAKVGNEVQALDWTGVLCFFSETSNED
ncbi:MAG: hypothetical protein JWQ40_3310 [Segetibacter sp.]|nr:hypothetical protein [Segetibacter sp.]